MTKLTVVLRYFAKAVKNG